MEKDQKKHTQHDPGHFDIALELACYVTDMELCKSEYEN
jgi:hypothetical protein